MYSITLLCPCELESERLSDQLVVLVFVRGKKKKNKTEQIQMVTHRKRRKEAAPHSTRANGRAHLCARPQLLQS